MAFQPDTYRGLNCRLKKLWYCNTPLLLFPLLLLLTHCNGQKQTSSGTHAVQASAISMGDTVSALGNSIWTVFQATNGDYWFGSDTNGVYRFDGNTLLHYSTDQGLSSNRIRGIQEDKQGNLFFSTLGGINKYDGHRFILLTAIKSTSPDDHWKLQPDDLWFHTLGKSGEKGPYRYDGEHLYQLEFPKHYLADEYFSKFPNNAWSPYEVYAIYQDHQGAMWFGTSNFGLCRYDGQSLSWLYEDHLTNVPNGGSFGIRSMLEDSKGKFWFCNTRYRFHISPDITQEDGKILINYEREKGIGGITASDGTDHVYFLSATEDNNGDLWMVTYNEGVWRYNGTTVTHYTVTDAGKDITLFSIYKDKQGALWLGTHANGAYTFNGQAFEKFKL